MDDPIRFLIIGLDHWIQRHQDPCAERVAARNSFEAAIRRLIQREGIQLTAEEAGGEEAVANLQKQGNLWAPFENRPPLKIKSETIAKTVVTEIHECRHLDIRPAGEWVHPQQDEEYERAMINRTLQEIGDARRILLLCGEDHRSNLSRQLSERGWDVQAHGVGWLLNS